MLLFHCSRWELRESIRCNGLALHSTGFVFGWPTLEAAHEYREKLYSGWCDIWAFDDRGESRDNPGGLMSGETVSLVVPWAVPPADLKLVHPAEAR